jgi:hypothetical protein
MESIREQAKKVKDFAKDRFSNNYRSIKLKYQGTKVHQNIDSLLKFQTVYYELINK